MSSTRRIGPPTNPGRRGSRAFLATVCIAIAGLFVGVEWWSRSEGRDPNQTLREIAYLEDEVKTVYELANAAQWTRATKRTNLLRATTARLETIEGRPLPELEHAIAELEHAIESHDVRRSARSANAVMRQAVLIDASLRGSDSATLLMLDVEARDVLIDASSDPVAADAAVARVARLWRELRPEVDRRGRHDLVEQCDSHIHALETGTATTRQSEARALLRTIDRVRDLFS